jgi:hypothetical protein
MIMQWNKNLKQNISFESEYKTIERNQHDPIILSEITTEFSIVLKSGISSYLTKKKINKEFFFSHLLDVLVCP